MELYHLHHIKNCVICHLGGYKFSINTHSPKGLVTNYGEGGATKREGGGAREVLPLRKGGGRKSFSHAEGGAQKVLGSFLRGSLKF